MAQNSNRSKWARNNSAAPLGLRCLLIKSDQTGAQKAGLSQGARGRCVLPAGIFVSAALPGPTQLSLLLRPGYLGSAKPPPGSDERLLGSEKALGTPGGGAGGSPGLSY